MDGERKWMSTVRLPTGHLEEKTPKISHLQNPAKYTESPAERHNKKKANSLAEAQVSVMSISGRIQ